MVVSFRPDRNGSIRSLPAAARIADALPDAAAPSTRTERRWWSPLLRFGVRPLFLAGDLFACAVVALFLSDQPRLTAAFTVIFIPFIAGAGLYRSRLSLSLLDHLPALVARWLISLAVLLAGTYLVFGDAEGLGTASLAGIAVILGRLISYRAVNLLRSSGLVSHGTVIVGADSTGANIAEKLARNPQYGLRPLGFLDNGTHDAAELPAPMLGVPHDLPEVLRRHSPRALVLAHSALPDRELVELVRACHRHSCEVFVIPRLSEVFYVNQDTEFVWDTPLVRLPRAAYRTVSWRLKRLVDVAFALVAIVLLSPVMLACALAVLLEGGPGVIFKQERVGCDGRRFWLLKFRSMRPATEAESQTQWNIAKDPRMGKVGRVLRITSLDELPQLFNILRGDMSLVGPRPERPHFVEEFGGRYPGYSARHRVPCGLTGWAQVHGLRGNTPIDDRARFDNFYIENWSLWLDLKILLMTAGSIVRSPGS